jgi:hypothetical protein
MPIPRILSALFVLIAMWSACLAADDSPASFPRDWQSPAAPLTEVCAIRGAELTLTDLAGDTYEHANSHRALLLQQPPALENLRVEVTLVTPVAVDPYAQAGLVLWWDADNYVRSCAGFAPAGYQCLAEFDAVHRSPGIRRLFPRENPLTLRLRLEVRAGVVFNYVRLPEGLWLAAEPVALPPALLGNGSWQIGLVGVGGRMSAPPVFRDWQVSRIPVFTPTLLNGVPVEGTPPWLPGLGTASGWGADETGIRVEHGSVRISPFHGADIYFGNSAYPFVEQPAPTGRDWTVTVDLAGTQRPRQGRWYKAGLVLWQGHECFSSIALLSDERSPDTVFEFLSRTPGAAAPTHLALGHRAWERAPTARLRFHLDPEGNLHASACYADQAWIRFPPVPWQGANAPRIRLFATRDPLMQVPDESAWTARFDTVSLDLPEPATASP